MWPYFYAQMYFVLAHDCRSLSAEKIFSLCYALVYFLFLWSFLYCRFKSFRRKVVENYGRNPIEAQDQISFKRDWHNCMQFFCSSNTCIVGLLYILLTQIQVMDRNLYFSTGYRKRYQVKICRFRILSVSLLDNFAILNPETRDISNFFR